MIFNQREKKKKKKIDSAVSRRKIRGRTKIKALKEFTLFRRSSPAHMPKPKREREKRPFLCFVPTASAIRLRLLH